MLQTQLGLAKENKATVSIVSVDSTASVILETVKNAGDYKLVPNGGTALLDGLYLGTFISNRHIDKFDRTLMICISDGQENASKYASWNLVDDTIGRLNKTEKFTVAFYGTIESLTQVTKNARNIFAANTQAWAATPDGASAMNTKLARSAMSYYASGASASVNFAGANSDRK